MNPHPPITDAYDVDCERACARWLPRWDWRRLLAQLYQESLCDPMAQSPVGAEGIAQFMPDTWHHDVIRGMGYPPTASPFEPYFAIPACAWYNKTLWDQWSMTPRTELDRWRLTLASYNAGIGNIVKAQKKAGGALDYAAIIGKLPFVTGKDNANQTRTYVDRIEHYYGLLTGKAELRA